jgi:two-component system sensor histidine kinase MprB
VSWFHGFSLRRRIAALVAASVFATVLAVGAAAWLYTRHTLLNQTDANLLTVATKTADDPNLLGAGGIEVPAVNQLTLPVGLVNAAGTPQQFANEITLPVAAEDARVAAGKQGACLRTVTYKGEPYRLVTVKVPNQPLALQVGQDISTQEQSLHKLAVLLLFVGVLGAAVAAMLGALVARTALRPVRALTAAAERVAQTDDLEAPITLSDRESTEDEVARLASSFNAMLAALAMSRDRQRALVADAGHELRTPLTSLRTNIELLAREDPASGRVLAPADRERLLADVTAQTAELASLIGDLTDLAREDSLQAGPEDVDLAEVAARAVERVRRRDTTVQLITDLNPSPVHGRPRQLERAVTNLLDNAVKWSPPGGEVFVGLYEGQLVVADQGPGIAEEDLPHIFERFYRATTSREQPGSGLGLAIVAQAAQEHGGTVAAERTPAGGTRMRLTVPLVADAPEPAKVP